MNLLANSEIRNTYYKSLIPEAIGNFAFNLGGMLEYSIYKLINTDDDPEETGGDIGLQYGLMLIYGICMPVAGGIYAFEKHPPQNHSLDRLLPLAPHILKIRVFSINRISLFKPPPVLCR